MAKRKNLHSYVNEVSDWDRFIDLDWRTGDWDVEQARARAASHPEQARNALRRAYAGLLKECVRYPSFPNRDEAMGVLDEGKDLGLEVAVMQDELRLAWEKARGEKW